MPCVSLSLNNLALEISQPLWQFILLQCAVRLMPSQLVGHQEGVRTYLVTVDTPRAHAFLSGTIEYADEVHTCVAARIASPLFTHWILSDLSLESLPVNPALKTALS